MSLPILTKEDRLTAAAKIKKPRVKRWFGYKNSGTTRRVYCYICGDLIDSDSASYPQTKHMTDAINAHREKH